MTAYRRYTVRDDRRLDRMCDVGYYDEGGGWTKVKTITGRHNADTVRKHLQKDWNREER